MMINIVKCVLIVILMMPAHYMFFCVCFFFILTYLITMEYMFNFHQSCYV